MEPTNSEKLARTLDTFIHKENVSFTDFAKQRQSVDLEKLFFGQDGLLKDDDDEDEGDNDEDGNEDEKKDGTKDEEEREKETENENDKKQKAGSAGSRPKTRKNKDGNDDARRKISDSSSGVADLSSPDHQPHTPNGHRRHGGGPNGEGSRRISVGWEKVQGLYHRKSLAPGGEDESDEARAARRNKKGKQKDKRVKTALRRLLNERLFGSSDKKKSRHDENGDVIGTADGSVTSSRFGTRQTDRSGTRQKGRSVEFEGADGSFDPRQGPLPPSSRGPRRLAFQNRPDNDNSNEDEEENGDDDGRLPTRTGLSLPPLRGVPGYSRNGPRHIFTPAHFPKWDIYVTNSERNILWEGLRKDQTILASRQQARTAWGSREGEMIVPPPRNGQSRGAETAADDDSSHLDPHRPDTESNASSSTVNGGTWATRLPPPTSPDGQTSVSQSTGTSATGIDDRRLRRLLEELYRDKVYMDKLINNMDTQHMDFPDHLAADDVKFLSEFGRGYLLDCAEYWDQSGTQGNALPPPTVKGMRLQRARTTMTSNGIPTRQTSTSEQDSLTSPRPRTVR